MTSCFGSKTDFNSDKEFEDYLNDPKNGFIQKDESKDFIFEARLIPALKNEGESQLTVQLRIKRKDGKSVLDSDDVSQKQALTREGYLSFDLAGDVHLEDQGKSIPVSLHHYERNYGIKQSVDILFNFKNSKPGGDVYFVYRDQVFNQGLIKIKFKKELFTSCYVKE